MVARIVRYVALAAMAAYGLLGSIFLIGTTLLAPGGWPAALQVVSWVVPLAGLATLALLHPERGATTLAWITALVIMFVLLLGSVGAIPRPPVGPVVAATVFTMVVALGFVALRQPWLAGLLILGSGASLAVATLLGAVISGMVHRHGLPLDESSAAVSVLTLAVGLLFLLAGALEPPSGWSGSGSVGDALRGGSSGLEPRDRDPER